MILSNAPRILNGGQKNKKDRQCKINFGRCAQLAKLLYVHYIKLTYFILNVLKPRSSGHSGHSTKDIKKRVRHRRTKCKSIIN